MSDVLTYRIRNDDTVAHAMMTLSSLKKQKRNQYKAQHVNKYNPNLGRKSVIGNSERVAGGRTTNPYGNQYKSPYYDPVYRHNYYEEHKTHATRAYGTGTGTSSTSSKSGKSSGSGKSGSGKSGSGSSKGGKSGASKTITSQIEKLKEESALDTEAHREATLRKIADLRAQIEAETEKLVGHEEEEGVNIAEIRGTIQSLKDQIEEAGLDLSKWIENEKEALERRIAALTGKKYDESAKDKAKQQQTKKDKEVNSRADKLYKRKYN